MNADTDLSLTQFHSVGKATQVFAELPLLSLGRILECNLHEGIYLFEGDIQVRESDLSMDTNDGAVLTYGHVVKNRQRYTWPDGIIPYVIEPGLEDVVLAGIRIWEEATPIRFAPITDQIDNVAFLIDSQSSSEVGRQGNRQIVRVSHTATAGVVAHEIGHVIGLWHENSRSDYEDHIKVHWDNIASTDETQFKQPVSNAEISGEYDYQSIMHYPRNAFAVDKSKDTITALNGAHIGQRMGLSAGDIVACRSLYPLLVWS